MSFIKLEYSYTEYKDYPIATEISKDRASLQAILLYNGALWFIISAIIFFSMGVPEGDWSGIWILLLFIPFFVYMIRYYPRVTEKKIQKAIAEQIQLQYDLANRGYKCKSIKLLDRHSTGKCVECAHPTSYLTLCKVKSDIGTKEINLCSDCIRKYQSNMSKK